MTKIKHVVVLMLENRSFDHMLGFAKRSDPRIDGLSGTESNPIDPANPARGSVAVSDGAAYQGQLAVDPGHWIHDVDMQLYGRATSTFDAQGNGDGFVSSYAAHHIDGDGAAIMKCFAPSKLPVLSTLAHEFAVCDAWHAPMPGPTWPNRFFVHAATSDGQVDDIPRVYPMRTIFDALNDAQHSWRVYFHDIPQCLALESLRKAALRGNIRRVHELFDDARTGNLPAYSFIEPRYTQLLFWHANDQHPDHDVALGETLVADVYEALRASPSWNETLLVIVHDEHGGTFDHVFPPPAANPDGKTWSDGELSFAFDRLGVRVPAVVVSPWIAKATVDHGTYDHTSILATVRSLFGLPHALTHRDAAAAKLDHLLSLATPRTDAPATLTRPDATRVREHGHPHHEHASAIEDALRALDADAMSPRPMNELQRSLVELALSLDVGETPLERALARARPMTTEHDAAVMVRERMTRFLGR